MCEKSPTQGFVLSRIKRAYVSIFDLFSYRLLIEILIKPHPTWQRWRKTSALEMHKIERSALEKSRANRPLPWNVGGADHFCVSIFGLTTCTPYERIQSPSCELLLLGARASRVWLALPFPLGQCLVGWLSLGLGAGVLKAFQKPLKAFKSLLKAF